jgi:DnaJ-class molecular chaperone
MSVSKYQLVENMLHTIKCPFCSGAGRTQYAASSPIVKCDACKGTGFAKGAKYRAARVVEMLNDIKH